jgi:hypothetical protein
MSSPEPGGRTAVTQLFIVTAAIEAGAGLVLLLAPALGITLLFGPAVDAFPATAIARLTGAALLSLGAGCWWARDDERSAASRALVRAMLLYNAAVVALLLFAGFGALGPPLWAVVVVHGAMAIWCAQSLPVRALSEHVHNRP